ncbi:hypothetical protein SAMN02949497_1759 [Methylomagnum ishizawai]|uniref:Uncharacterized protein n=1 Tax=Methylomagnum ishizawai TaxID=1760988 RepID=A0A1Y6D225_9GAMM|nr:hypothetical protein [Methylomagnum ishizawai]SMF94444.1 hypothetical protein SAMN02949497_1759 [Methylomagnum ishizawai]
MSTSTEITPFSWGDVSLSEVVHVNGIPHATKTAIGEWLEYADPRDGVNKVLERNPYIEEFSTAVKLTAVDGKLRDTTVYHPMGLLLVVMESGQPKAQAAKVAIAAFVWHFCGGSRPSLRDAVSLRAHLLKALAALQSCKCAFSQRLLLDQIREVCRELGQPVPDVALIGKDPKQTALEGF